MSNYISNVSDQLEGFSEQVATCVKHIEEYYRVTTNEAIRIVEIATKSIQCDNVWHFAKRLILEDVPLRFDVHADVSKD